LARYCNPFVWGVWDVPVSRADVRRALKENRLVSAPTDHDHAGRIAFLIKNEASDAIEIDVGAPDLGLHVRWPVQTGTIGWLPRYTQCVPPF
jgi:hypothetical protein